MSGDGAHLLVAHGGQLILAEAEVVAQFVDDSLADLFHDFLAAVETALVGPLKMVMTSGMSSS